MRRRAVAVLALHAVPVHRRDRVELALHLVLRRRVAVDARDVDAVRPPCARRRRASCRTGPSPGRRASRCCRRRRRSGRCRSSCAAGGRRAGRRPSGRRSASGLPAPPPFLTYVPLVSWQARQSTLRALGEVEGLVAPAVADVALVAALAAAGDADAEVVQEVLLADVPHAAALDVLARSQFQCEERITSRCRPLWQEMQASVTCCGRAKRPFSWVKRPWSTDGGSLRAKRARRVSVGDARHPGERERARRGPAGREKRRGRRRSSSPGRPLAGASSSERRVHGTRKHSTIRARSRLEGAFRSNHYRSIT